MFIMKFMLRSLRNSLHKFVYQSTVLFSQISNKSNGNYKRNKLGIFGIKIIIGTTVVGYLGYHLYGDYLYRQRNFVSTQIEKVSSTRKNSVGEFKKGLPSYPLSEISKHNSMGSRVWVTYKEGVYDITEYVAAHPGGDQILMAGGSSLEPFWLIYSLHHNEHVYEILEEHRIGNLRKEDVGLQTGDTSDPFIKDPVRHPTLKSIHEKPFNGSCPPSLLVESFITPNEFFYVRNHLFVPEIDPNKYEVEVKVEGRETITFTLDQLKKLPKHTITATLMCIGNRRTEMAKVKPLQGVMWGLSAIGNAKWTGVRLRDILKIAGINEDEEIYKHVHFVGLDFDVAGTNYSGSIPIWRALEKRCDVLLVYEMNGVPLSRDHGFPLRLLQPGCAGCRNVKWIGKIIVSEKENDSHWQQNDYKGVSPSADFDNVDFSKSPAIQELPLTSAICQPAENDTVDVIDGHIFIKGYAWSGNGQKIVRVDVTADGGKTWYIADLYLQDTALPPQHWSWTLWSINIPVGKNLENVEIWAKAVDNCYNTQPESFQNIYNFRGVLNNAYHRVKVNLNY